MGVGGELRKARLERGVSLRRVEEETKIRARYLEAIERENWGELPGRVYAIGFVRTYCRYLGIDAEPLVRELKGILRDEDGDLQPVVRGRRPRRPRGGISRTHLAVVVVTVILIALTAIGYYQLTTRENSGPAGGEVASSPVEESGSFKPPEEVGVQVVISAVRGDCWLRVLSDGRLVYEQTLSRGSEQTFTARERLRVTFGNAGAVLVNYNGTDLGPLGRPGDVITREFALGG